MEPTNAIETEEANRDRNAEAMDILISEIKDDPDSTAREDKLASAIVALKES